jgi:galactoside O-acetyltransferase
MNNPFDSGYFNETELKTFGLKSVGDNVQIAKNCTIVGLSNISIGSNVRIDSYCSIMASGSGWLNIGSYVHVAAYCYLAAGAGINLEDFSGLSQGVRIYSKTDDYTGHHMTNPMVPEKYTGVTQGTVTIKKHVIIGTGSVILPKVTIEEGSAVGALSLVTKKLPSWGVYFGCPVERIKDRSRKLLELELQFIAEAIQ